MLPKLDVRHLRVVAAVAEHGGVTKASRHLHLTQSAVSHQLRDAEEKVGQRLFLRGSGGMVPTAAGEKILATARRVLAELAGAEAEVEAISSGEAGLVRIATECYTCYQWLPALLTRVRVRYPRAQIRVAPGETRFPIAGVLEHRLDLAIISSGVEHQDIRSERLFEDELLIAVSPRHRLAGRRTVEPADLDGERVIIYPPEQDSYLLHRVLYPAGATPSEVLEIPLTEAMVELVRADMGIALMARWATVPYVKSRRIRAKPLAGGFRRQWSAAWHRDAPPSGPARELVQLLKSSRAPMAYLD